MKYHPTSPSWGFLFVGGWVDLDMVRLLSLLFIIRISFADTKTVAISYFDNTSGTEEYNPLSKGLADMLITDLSNVKSLKIVEREKLESLLKEIELGDGKFIDPNTAQKLGKGLGAGYMLTGSFLIMGETMRIDARLVDVGTGEISMAEEITGEKDTFFELEKSLVTKLIATLNIDLSKKESRKVKKVQTESFEAFSAYSYGLNALDNGMPKDASSFMEQAIEFDSKFDKAYDKLDLLEEILDDIAKNTERVLKKVTNINEKVSSGFNRLEESMQNLLQKSDYILLPDSFLLVVDDVMMSKEYEQALELYRKSLADEENRLSFREKIVTMVPKSDIGYFSKSYLLFDDKKTAMDLLDTALAINPLLSTAYINKSALVDDKQEKINLLNTAISINDKGIIAYRMRAEIYATSNDPLLYQKAKIDFRRIIDLEKLNNKYEYSLNAFYNLMQFAKEDIGDQQHCDYFEELIQILNDKTIIENYNRRHDRLINYPRWLEFKLECVDFQNELDIKLLTQDILEYQYKEIRCNVIINKIKGNGDYISDNSDVNDQDYILFNAWGGNSDIYSNEQIVNLFFNKKIFKDDLETLQNIKKGQGLMITAKVIPGLFSYKPDIELNGLEVTSFSLGWTNNEYFDWLNHNYATLDNYIIKKEPISGHLSDIRENKIDITLIKHNSDELQNKYMLINNIPISGKSYNYGGIMNDHIDSYIEYYVIDKESNEKYYYYFKKMYKHKIESRVNNMDNIFSMNAYPLASKSDPEVFNNQFVVSYFDINDFFHERVAHENEYLPNLTLETSKQFLDFINHVNILSKKKDWESWFEVLNNNEFAFKNNPTNLNSFAWNIYSMPELEKYLSKAKEWSYRSIELDETASYCDTYSHINHKMGNLNEAIVYVKKAIKLAKKEESEDSRIQYFQDYYASITKEEDHDGIQKDVIINDDSSPKELDIEKELERFKRLLDKGLITKDIYDAKVKQLLGL